MKFLLVIFLLLTPLAQVYSPGSNIPPYPKQYATEDPQVVMTELLRKLIFIYAPRGESGMTNFLQRLSINDPRIQLNDAQRAAFIQAFPMRRSFLSLHDPVLQDTLGTFLGLQRLEPCQAIINTEFEFELDTLMARLRPATPDIESIIANGVESLLSTDFRGQLANDKNTLNKAKSGLRPAQKHSIGGDYNRYILMLYEVAPFLDDLHRASQKGSCEFALAFYQSYVQSRQLAEVLQALMTFIHKGGDRVNLDTLLGQKVTALRQQLLDLYNTTYLNPNPGIDMLRQSLRLKMALREVLTPEAILTITGNLFKQADVFSRLQSLVMNPPSVTAITKTILDSLWAIESRQMRGDETGVIVDLFRKANTKIWLRIRLSEGISQEELSQQEHFTRDAEFFLVLGNGITSIQSRQDFDRLYNQAGDFNSKNLRATPRDSEVEVPLGLKTRSLVLNRSATDTDIRIRYPGREVSFGLQYAMSKVWGSLQTDPQLQVVLMETLGLSESHGIRLHSIRPAIRNDKFMFDFQVALPTGVSEVLGKNLEVSLSLDRLIRPDARDFVEVGRNIMTALAQEVKQQLATAFNKTSFRDKISDRFILNLDSLSVTLSRDEHFRFSLFWSGLNSNIKEYLSVAEPFQVGLSLYRQAGQFKTLIQTDPISLSSTGRELVTEKLAAALAAVTTVDEDDLREILLLRLQVKSFSWQPQAKGISTQLVIDIGGRPRNIATLALDAAGFRIENLLLEPAAVMELMKSTVTAGVQEYLGGASLEQITQMLSPLLEGVLGWQVNQPQLTEQRFSIRCHPVDDASQRINVLGELVNGVPRISRIENFNVLKAELDAYINTHLGKWSNSLISLQDSYFEGTRYVMPIVLNLDFLGPAQKLGDLVVTLDGNIQFNGDRLNSGTLLTALRNTINTEAMAIINGQLQQQGTYTIHGMEIQNLRVTQFDAAASIAFTGRMHVYEGVSLNITVGFDRNGPSIRVDHSADALVEAALQKFLGALVDVPDLQVSTQPLGVRGTVAIRAFGISLPPVNFLITRDGVKVELGVSFVLPGCYTIAPGVVMIDPMLTVYLKDKVIKGTTVFTVGASEEARATARLVRINGFVTLPFSLKESILMGGDLILVSVLPVLHGRGEVNIPQGLIRYATTTAKPVKFLVDFQQQLQLSGRDKAFSSKGSIDVLGIAGGNFSLAGKVHRSHVALQMTGNANIPLAEFHIDAATRMDLGPFAVASAAVNSEMTLGLAVAKKILGISLAEINGEASIHQARFDVGILGAKIGITLPSPSNLNSGVILDLLLRMFDFKIDWKSLLESPDLEQFLELKLELSIPGELTIGSPLPGRMGGGGKSGAKGKRNGRGTTTKTPTSDSDLSGNLRASLFASHGSISFVNEEIRVKKTQKYSCGIFFTCTRDVWVPVSRFNKNAWGRTFRNLPAGYQDAAVIFDPRPVTAEIPYNIKSIVGPFSTGGRTFSLVEKRDNYDFLHSSAQVECLFSNGTESPFLQKSQRGDSIRRDSVYSINLGFEKNSSKLIVFVSYNLKPYNTPPVSQPLRRNRYRQGQLDCKRCSVIDTSFWEYASNKNRNQILPQNTQVFKFEGKPSERLDTRRYRDIGSDSTLDMTLAALEALGGSDSDSKKWGNQTGLTLRLGEKMKDVLQRGLKKFSLTDSIFILANRVNDLPYFFATKTLSQVGVILTPSNADSDSLYNQASRVWIEVDAALLKAMLQRDGQAIDDSQLGLQAALTEKSKDPAFSNVFAKVLNEIIRTDGKIKIDQFEIEQRNDFKISILAITPPNQPWSPDGPKKFIIREATASSNTQAGFEPGAEVVIDFHRSFGNPRFSNAFQSELSGFTAMKTFIESRSSVLRNLLLTVLYMKSKGTDMGHIYPLYVAKDKILLAKFLETDFSSLGAHYTVIPIDGNLFNRIALDNLLQKGSPTLITRGFHLERAPVSDASIENLVPNLPYTNIPEYNVYWAGLFETYTNQSTYRITRAPNQSTEKTFTTMIMLGDQIQFSWIGPEGIRSVLPSPRTLTVTAARLREQNRKSEQVVSNFRGNHEVTPDQLCSLLNDALNQSADWFNRNQQVNPLVIFAKE